MDFEAIFKNVSEKGDFDVWKKLCSDLRKNIPLRMMMAASFASVLLEPLKYCRLCCTCGERPEQERRWRYGGNVHLGEPADGRSGKDHEHDQECHYA